MNSPIAPNLVVAVLCCFMSASGRGAETRGNLLMNSGFENGVQFWKGDGKVVTVQPQNIRVYEIDASKSRLKEVSQDFKLKELKSVEVVFRARSINYKGPGLRISIHTPGSGSLLWTKKLPEDGSWTDYRLEYITTNSKDDLRELIIATHLGTGQVQIDDVEVREPTGSAPANTPSKPVPTTTPAITPAPSSPPIPVPSPAVAQDKPVSTQIEAAGSFPTDQASTAKELMGFQWDWLASGGNYNGKTFFESNGDALDAGTTHIHGDWRINADSSLTYRRGDGNSLVWVLKRVAPNRFEGGGVAGAALGRTCSLTRSVPR